VLFLADGAITRELSQSEPHEILRAMEEVAAV
jgi:hypothetical protein